MAFKSFAFIGSAALSLVCHAGAWVRDRSFSSLFTPLPQATSLTDAVFRGMSPVLHLGGTVEQTLVAGTVVNLPQGLEHGRAGPATYLIFVGVGKGEMPSSPALSSLCNL